MALQVSARRVVGPSGSSSAEVIAVRATASASAAIPVVSDGSPSWPTAETTGTTGSLTPTSISAFDNGVTYEDLNITDASGDFRFYAENCTFINCRLPAGWILSAASGNTFSYCTFTDHCGLSSSSDVLIDHCKMVNMTGDAFHVSGDNPPGARCLNVTIQNCYVSDHVLTSGNHNDGIQVRGSDNLQFLNNWINFNRAFDELDNAGFFVEEANGGNTNFLADGNYFNGGGHTLYLTDGQGTFSNNTVAIGGYGSYIYDGATPLVAAGITGTGNVKAEDGTPLLLHP